MERPLPSSKTNAVCSAEPLRFRGFGMGGVFHSDELPNYGIEESDLIELKSFLQINENDAFLIFGFLLIPTSNIYLVQVEIFFLCYGIVVTENIFRKLEVGLNLKDAAREGSKEIFFAVISTSITLAVVFMPVIFLQGFIGSLFKEFGVVVAGAVLVCS